MVVVLVVSLDVELKIFYRWENSNVIKTRFKIRISDVTLSINIEDSKGIIQVEIWSLSNRDLSIFYFFFK